MTMLQTTQAKLMAPVAVALTAGVETVNIYEVDLSKGYVAADDLIEIGLIPAFSRITEIKAIGVNTGAITADIGILSGDWGEANDDRTMPTVLLNDVSLNNATADGAPATLLAVAPSDKNRSLGMNFSGNIAAGAGKKVTVIVRTIMA